MKLVRVVGCRGAVILLIIAVVLNVHLFIAAGFVNVAQILTSRGVIAQSEHSDSPLQTLIANAAFEPIHSMLETAILLNPHNLSARRILYLKALIARNQAGDYAGLIRQYGSASPDVSQVNRGVNDIIALAYLERAKNLLTTGDYLSARSDLEASLTLRPSDLYALSKLLDLDTRAGNSQKADIWRDQLIRFTDDALYFPDAHLADFAADAIPQLVSDGIWERSVALNSAALLAWRESSSPGTERLLRRLAVYYPTEPEWNYLLGEAYQRQGRLTDAYVKYQQALAADPPYDPAWLRLGITCEALILSRQSGCTLPMAREFYMAYTSVYPNDTVALTKLLEVERKLGIRTVERAARLYSLEDERLILAEQFNLTPDVIALGPNLISNPGFEALSGPHPAGWHESNMSNYPPFDQALFYSGLDSLGAAQGNLSARVSGLWLGNNTKRGSPNSGFWVWNDSNQTLQSIPVEGGAIYLLSFFYRTAWIKDLGSTVYLNAGISSGGSFGGEHALPPTEGAWRQVSLIGITSDNSPNSVLPLLRLWGPGQAWFDNVQLRQVKMPTLSFFAPTPSPILVIR